MASKSRRIVLKFGSGILSNTRGTSLDDRQFRRLCAEIAGLVKEGHEVVVVDNLTTGRRENLNLRAAFYPVDIRSSELEAVFEAATWEVGL